MRTRALVLALVTALWLPLQAKTLNFRFIDVEGGQATLVVTPDGQSLLFDAGWPGYNGRDSDRIAAAARQSGLSRIDYLVVTHHHLDHVGGVEELVAKIPVGTFVDHGPNTETGKAADALTASYARVLERGRRLTVKPGDALPLKGVTVRVVSARGELITKPLKGAGKPNPLCAGVAEKKPDPTENGRSIGVVIDYGRFRLVNLADLTWNLELKLACPNNLLGTADVYLSTHHGMDLSGPAAIVHALRPRVAIMNNGAKKGNSAAAWQVIRDSPGLEDFYQLHLTVTGGSHNVAEEHIANLEAACEGKGFVLAAEKSGAFSVLNERTGKRKSYAARK